MVNKIFDIPFRSFSTDSDFVCMDGEVAMMAGSGLSSGENTGKTTPPVPDIDFALTREVLAGWHAMADNFPAKTLTATEPTMEYWNKLASQLLGRFQSEAASQKMFVSPFYVTAVWKTKDGIYLSPTEPLLMIPNSEVPAVTTDSDVKKEELEFRIAAAVCGLKFRMRAPEILRDFVGEIVSLEIMTSEPLYNYHNFPTALPTRNLNTESYCRSLDPETGEITDQRVCTATLDNAWTIPYPTIKTSELNYYRFASVPLSEVDRFENWGMEYIIRNIEKESKGIKYQTLQQGLEDLSTSLRCITIRGDGSKIDITTRPLKLSGAGIFNRIRKVFLRGHFDPTPLTVKVYGSRDMNRWWSIGIRKGGAMVQLPPSMFRFYKISVSGVLPEDETLEGLSMVQM